MSCSPFELKDYFLQELADPQRRQVEAHIRTCETCREEMDRLRLTEAALFALREEEIPQRIAFVSDPVFEPSAWRRTLSAFWNSGPRLGFASAAVLSAALIVFAVTRPAPAPVVQVTPAAQTAAAASPAISPTDIQARIDAAVAKAMAPVEARHEQDERVIRQAKAELETARQRLLVAAQEYDYNSRKQGASVVMLGLAGPPERGNGDVR